jgi:hypothetical protein
MGYFSNGTEGEMYWETWCTRCEHDRNEDCPIWAIHLQYNYKAYDKSEAEPVVKDILSQLIPRSKDGLGNEQCAMFVERDTTEDFFSPTRGWVKNPSAVGG